MLTKAQEDYLEKIPADKISKVTPYQTEYKDVADKIINEIRPLVPGLDIRLIGSVGLGIAGQNDLDIYILCLPEKIPAHTTALQKKFGAPLHKHPGSVEWDFMRGGLEVELALTDPTAAATMEQLNFFDRLSGDSGLRNKYENIKLQSNGKPYREYQRNKYEFFNQVILG